MRGHLVLPVLVAAALGLTACGGDTDTTSPDGTASPSPTTTDAPASPDPADSPTDATEPTEQETVAGDCSAAGMTADGADLARLPDQARAAAAFLLDAALRCDEQLLATAAFESGTTLTFGEADPYEFFGLPEQDEEIYAIIATLLTETPYAAEADDATPATFVWPRVHTSDWVDADQAWQEVVDAGLLTAAEADEMRAAGTGYLGWRLGITGEGDWQFFVAGD